MDLGEREVVDLVKVGFSVFYGRGGILCFGEDRWQWIWGAVVEGLGSSVGGY